MSGPSSRVSRVLMVGPLAPFADGYAAELRRRGHAPAVQDEAWEVWRGECPTGKEAATWIIETRRIRSLATPTKPEA